MPSVWWRRAKRWTMTWNFILGMEGLGSMRIGKKSRYASTNTSVKASITRRNEANNRKKQYLGPPAEG
jgi:hypothetical protein